MTICKYVTRWLKSYEFVGLGVGLSRKKIKHLSSYQYHVGLIHWSQVLYMRVIQIEETLLRSEAFAKTNKQTSDIVASG